MKYFTSPVAGAYSQWHAVQCRCKRAAQTQHAQKHIQNTFKNADRIRTRPVGPDQADRRLEGRSGARRARVNSAAGRRPEFCPGTCFDSMQVMWGGRPPASCHSALHSSSMCGCSRLCSSTRPAVTTRDMNTPRYASSGLITRRRTSPLASTRIRRCSVVSR